MSIVLNDNVDYNIPAPADPRTEFGAGCKYATKEDIPVTKRYATLVTTNKETGEEWGFDGNGVENSNWVNLSLKKQVLERINEGENTGFRIIGRNPDYFGNIGQDAVDFSFSDENESSESGATGDWSLAFGLGVKASGRHSHAEGWQSIASGEYSFAHGELCEATKRYAFAHGENTFAHGYGSHAEGSYSMADGSYSHAEGEGTSASGNNSHSEGAYSATNGNNSHSEGEGTSANGENSHSEGDYTTASGDGSHAEGKETRAVGNGSHAEGEMTASLGFNSHAEGTYTESTGASSHAEGRETKSIGINSHAEGEKTKSIGINSHAGGLGTIAQRDNSTALGFYNKGISNALLELGIGNASIIDPETGDETLQGKNAFEIFDNGILVAPELTIELIEQLVATENVLADKILVTREFLEHRILFTGLEKITENGKTGFRLVGKEAGNYGDIGENAVDMSVTGSPSTEHGATGTESFAIGWETIASGEDAFAGMALSKATAYGAFAFSYAGEATGSNSVVLGGGYGKAMGSNSATIGGSHNEAWGMNSIVIGNYSRAEKTSSIAIGERAVSKDKGAIAIGKQVIASNVFDLALGTANTGESGAILELGAGDIDGEGEVVVRKNALEVFKDGTIKSPNVTNSLIDDRGSKTLINKEYLEYKLTPKTVADETALLAEKTAGNMDVWSKYVITTASDGTANLKIEIKFQSPDGEFWYERIDNTGTKTTYKVQ